MYLADQIYGRFDLPFIGQDKKAEISGEKEIRSYILISFDCAPCGARF